MEKSIFEVLWVTFLSRKHRLKLSFVVVKPSPKSNPKCQKVLWVTFLSRKVTYFFSTTTSSRSIVTLFFSGGRVPLDIQAALP